MVCAAHKIRINKQANRAPVRFESRPVVSFDRQEERVRELSRSLRKSRGIADLTVENGESGGSEEK